MIYRLASLGSGLFLSFIAYRNSVSKNSNSYIDQGNYDIDRFSNLAKECALKANMNPDKISIYVTGYDRFIFVLSVSFSVVEIGVEIKVCCISQLLLLWRVKRKGLKISMKEVVLKS